MSALILHHYALSPFSEKIRRLFAYKQLPWAAVEQPLMAPKPDLVPLTGGYRRIPVLQIGADVYCDTALIARVIEEQHPAPPVLPAALAGSIALIEDWADNRLFHQVVPPVVVELLPALPPEFLVDRAAMTGGFSRATLEAAAPHAETQIAQSLIHLESQLTHAPWLLGAAFTVADAACYHCLWFMQNSPRLFEEVKKRPALHDWFSRIAAMSGDRPETLTNAQALDLARDARPQDVGRGVCADPVLRAGQEIEIIADDYGQEITRGRLVQLTPDRVTVTREDPRVGEVAVHYPRAGYRLTVSG